MFTKFRYVIIPVLFILLLPSCSNKSVNSSNIFTNIYESYDKISSVDINDDIMYFVGIKNDVKSVGFYDLSSKQIQYGIYDLDINERIVDFDVCKDGKIAMLKYSIDYENITELTDLKNKEKYELIKINNCGNIESYFNLNKSVNMSDAIGFYTLEIDDKGNMYVVDYNGDIWIMDENGNYLFDIDNNDGEFKNLHCSSEGSVFAITSPDEYNYVINKIDVKKKGYGSCYHIDNMKNVYTFAQNDSGIKYIKDNVLYNFSIKEDKKNILYTFDKKESIDNVSNIALLADGRYVIINSKYDIDTTRYNSIYICIK